MGALILRELRRAWTGGGLITPVVFFLLVAVLFPFAVGPDGALLSRVGGGVIWAAALLAALLPVERLVTPDLDSGILDQLTVRRVSVPMVMLAKTAAHWLGFAPALMAAALIAAGLLDLSAVTLARVEAGLAIGTVGLAALAVATGALTAGLRGAGALAGLLMLPLAVPLLIFGAGAVQQGTGALKLLGAVSLLYLAGAPYVAAAAIGAARD
ncbi:heme exporter protein CcmB [Sphingomonas gellani]|uniref:heme exporter protein CcmB n=1 Tax=Sphingomonas gellani TaxID=1166340 RepID=UPI000B85376F|nr:heme exporter protein CcmB [Sphingomonas gellani]